MLGRVGMRCAFVAALILGTASLASAADDGVWSVSKSSGEVWLATNGAQPVSLNQEETLKPGDTIRTGRNGRVLLVRGEETILISPNSVVGLPAEKKEGLSTTIIQQAGSILLEVEKRNVKHFEVETPYLAAVVKGTQFSVTVNAGSTKVGVLRGQVEVSDFKSGQIAQVMPGQAATVFEHGKPGLSLSGAGTFNPIEHGKPRASSIERVPGAEIGPVGTAQRGERPCDPCARSDRQGHQGGRRAEAIASGGRRSCAQGRCRQAGVVRISSPLGEVKLNVHKVTHGLAHGAVTPGQVRNANASTGTRCGATRKRARRPRPSNSTSPDCGYGEQRRDGWQRQRRRRANTTIAATTAGASSDGSAAAAKLRWQDRTGNGQLR